MADDETGARPLAEDALEPEDALHVEVVGRLVHQEDVGCGRQFTGDGQALLPAARQRIDAGVAIGETRAAERLGDAAGPVVLVHVGQRRRQDLGNGEIVGKHRILRHVAEADATAERAGAAVGGRHAGEDLEESGFAGAVGSDETGLVAFEQPERQIVEERPSSVGLAHRLTTEQERPGHSTSLLLLLRLLLLLLHALALRHWLTSSLESLRSL